MAQNKRKTITQHIVQITDNFIELFKEYPDTSAKIIGRLGSTGSGKTLDQTEQDVIPALLADEDVWCSYWINWNKPNLHFFHPKDFQTISGVTNALIVFDEIRQSFDPRSWENESEEIRAFFEFHRKRHNDIVFNTQDVSLVAKTIGIQAHEWSRIERVKDNFFKRFLYNLIKQQGPTIRKDYLKFSELKKMAHGWELGEDVGLNAEWLIKHYPINDILHRELNEYKIELVHRYCPRCQSRQGEQILKEQTNKICKVNTEGYYILRNKEYCPKHKNVKLEIRESGIYDTDFEPKMIERPDIIWKPFYPSPEGHRYIEYKGALSDRQLQLRNELTNTDIN